MVQCPACQEKNTGKVGSKQYYCRNCLVEFRVTGNSEVKLYYVESDGSLVEMEKDQVNRLIL